MTKTKQDKTPAREPDLAATLSLIGLHKTKATDQRSGYVLVFNTPIDNAALKAENEAEPKKVMHGALTLTIRNLFADPEKAEQNGKPQTIKLTFSGKLRRRDVAARKEAPAYSRWTFTLNSRPTREHRFTLMDLAAADGDEVESECHAEFTVQAENAADAPQGPELFTEGKHEEMSEEDKKLMDGDFDQGAEANKLPKDPKTGEYLQPGEFEADAEKKSKRKRKVEAA